MNITKKNVLYTVSEFEASGETPVTVEQLLFYMTRSKFPSTRYVVRMDSALSSLIRKKLVKRMTKRKNEKDEDGKEYEVVTKGYSLV